MKIPQELPNKVKGYLMILVSAILFSSYGVWCRLMGKEFGIFFQGWVRSAMILALLLPIVILKKLFKPIKRAHWKWFGITMLFTVFTQAPLYFAFNHLPLGTANFIFYGLFLITTYVIAWLFLSEKMTKVKMFSLVLALSGLVLTCGFSLAVFSFSAMLWAAFNGIASGGEIATSKKSTKHYSSLHLTFYSWVFILVTHLPLSLVMHEVQVKPTWSLEWIAMLGYALAGLGGFWLIIEGFKYVDASIGGLIGLLELVFSVLLGAFLFHDELSIPVMIGGMMILLSAVLSDVAALKNARNKPLPPPPSL